MIVRRKNDLLCLLGEDGRGIIKKEKMINVLERTKICKEFAITAIEAEACFGGSLVTWWGHGDEEMVE